MRPAPKMAAACAVMSVTLDASAARAALIDATVAGPVVSQSGTGYATGQTLTGSFTYDTGAGRYASFDVGAYTLPAGADSYVPPPLTATQTAQFAATAPATNTTLAVTLQTKGPFNTTDLTSFVQNPGAVTTNPSDPNPSTITCASQGASQGATGSATPRPQTSRASARP